MKHKPLYAFSLMLFFWSIFDGVISYITPLVITGEGMSKSAMGLIYASSSIFGAIFDLVLSRYLKNAHFRRLFLLMFVVCMVYPLILWQSKSVIMYLLAMATWGLYYDLVDFGTFDFVGRKMANIEHASSFGVIDVFRALGHLVAPVLAGVVIIKLVTFQAYAISWFFLILAAIVFVVLLFLIKRHKYEYIKVKYKRNLSLLSEFDLWKKITLLLLPVLFINVMVFVQDAFFWTIGPLFSEEFANIHPLNGMFMAGYTLPALFVGWFVGGLITRFGKKRTTYVSFLLGSLILVSFILVKTNPILLFVAVLISSAFTSITATTVKGMFVDQITKTPSYESEIEAVSDVSVNLGYVIGPATAGFLADKLGNMESFSVLGIVGVIFTLYMISKDRRSHMLPGLFPREKDG